MLVILHANEHGFYGRTWLLPKEPAQLYVALSRFRSLESVSISSLPSRLPRVTPARQRAMAFHETIGPVALAAS